MSIIPKRNEQLIGISNNQSEAILSQAKDPNYRPSFQSRQNSDDPMTKQWAELRKNQEELMKTSEGRTFFFDLLLLNQKADEIEDSQTKIALLKKQISILETIQSGEWRKFLPVKPVERVYFILDPDRKCIKIGFSANVDARFENLQHGNPSPLRLLATVVGGRSREYQIHKRVRHLRLHGEWFKDCKELRGLIKELTEGDRQMLIGE